MKINLLPIFFIAFMLQLSAQNETISLDSSLLTSSTTDLQMADFNGDGVNEFVLLTGGVLAIYYIQEYIEHTWEADTIGIPTVFPIFNLKAGDIDNDEDNDVILMTTGFIEFFVNDGLGNFEHRTFAVEHARGSMRNIGLCDFDSDGDVDICAGTDQYIFWLENIDSWEDLEVHYVSEITVAMRGASCLDWDQDGDYDILGETGGLGLPLEIFIRQGNGVWNRDLVPGSQGGVYNTSFADIDGDNIPEVGLSAQNGPVIINTVNQNVQLIPYEQFYSEAGQFVNYKGHSLWIQFGYPEGQIIYAEFDENGIADDIVETDIYIPLTIDFEIYDGDNNGSLDLFFAGFHSTTRMGVIPDFDLGLDDVAVADIEKSKLKMYYANGQLSFQSSGNNSPSAVAIYDMGGRLVHRSLLNKWQNQVTISNGDLPTGIYIAEFTLNSQAYSQKFWVND